MIRPATRDDAGAVARISHLGWTVAYAPFIEARLRPAAAEPEVWVGRLDHGNYRTYVFDRGDGVVGFVSVGATEPVGDEPPDTGIVLALYVDPAAEDHGVGSELLDAGLDHLRGLGMRQAILWTFVENARARTFYERRGWTAEPGSAEPHHRVRALELRYRRPL